MLLNIICVAWNEIISNIYVCVENIRDDNEAG